jgi:hypothetical protein
MGIIIIASRDLIDNFQMGALFKELVHVSNVPFPFFPCSGFLCETAHPSS